MRTIIVASLLILLAAVACGTETPGPVATTEPTTTVASALPTNTPVPSPTVEPTPTSTPTSTPTPVEIADGLARLWVDDNKDLIITELLGVFTVEVPLAGQLSDTVLRGKATENLDIVFAVPSRIGEGLYRLPVKAETDLEFDLPLVGTRAYTVALPFNVDIDIESRAVADWSFDISSATVEEIEPSS